MIDANWWPEFEFPFEIWTVGSPVRSNSHFNRILINLQLPVNESSVWKSTGRRIFKKAMYSHWAPFFFFLFFFPFSFWPFFFSFFFFFSFLFFSFLSFFLPPCSFFFYYFVSFVHKQAKHFQVGAAAIVSLTLMNCLPALTYFQSRLPITISPEFANIA